jgi:hypothetical protein
LPLLFRYMEDERVRFLLEQQYYGKNTSEEQQELAALLKKDSHADLIKALIADMMQHEKPGMPAKPADYSQMAQDIVMLDKTLDQPAGRVTRSSFSLYRWAAAAVIVMLVGTLTYFNVRNRSLPLSGNFENLPVLAASNQNLNTLSFPDGSIIQLDKVANGVIASQGNVTIRKQDNQIIYSSILPIERPEYHVLSIASNSDYELLLGDGSHIRLNAATSIRFPSVFPVNKRVVELLGEAWFDVQHADKQPFLVYSGHVATTVMGTAFNIKAYPDQDGVNVAVQRGRVTVASANKPLAILEIGEQAQIIKDTITYLRTVDTLSIASWRQGILLYENEPLIDVVADLQRIFKDSIVVKGRNLRSLHITAHYRKREGLPQILAMLSKLSDCRLSESNRIFVLE